MVVDISRDFFVVTSSFVEAILKNIENKDLEVDVQEIDKFVSQFTPHPYELSDRIKLCKEKLLDAGYLKDIQKKIISNIFFEVYSQIDWLNRPNNSAWEIFLNKHNLKIPYEDKNKLIQMYFNVFVKLTDEKEEELNQEFSNMQWHKKENKAIWEDAVMQIWWNFLTKEEREEILKSLQFEFIDDYGYGFVAALIDEAKEKMKEGKSK